ncbi:hypothetical protein [Rhizobium sp. SSA_523]|uniref:hypothetical protein n=1 Tax=Rhizobium sp. SSA_523 TaxID=2952477 RepID=UPI002091DC8E|nr:hypothetical protein [Rhizobium sp. SSA_523]MCO5733011.1 hypothetical protein [Rhizobium sp. SSA_523]WKC23892.1 hypothetical protein QTJ18_24500 [Rhizobium sp. SSA_523]
MNRIILARYLESVDWIVDVPDDFEVIIYNKGDAITSPSVIRKAARIIGRPNVGRESETYLHHMLTEVKDDSDFTVYAQADPFTHSPDFLELLSVWRHWDDLQPLSWCWKEDSDVPPKHLLNEYRQRLDGRLRIRPERFSLHSWSPVEFYDKGAVQTGLTYRELHPDLADGGNMAAHFLQLAGLPEIAEKAEAHSLGIFSYGALFAARNELITELPAVAGQQLYRATMAHPCYGYVLERMWLHFFGCAFELPRFLPALQEAVHEVEEWQRPQLVAAGGG